MKSETLKRHFINECYNGDYKAYLRARKADYCKVQLKWLYWIDSLCKNGEITQRQYDKVTF